MFLFCDLLLIFFISFHDEFPLKKLLGSHSQSKCMIILWPSYCSAGIDLHYWRKNERRKSGISWHKKIIDRQRERERETKQCKHSWRQPLLALLAYLRVPQTLFTYSPARPPILSCWLVNLFQVLCCSHCLTTSARIVLYTTTLFICWSQLEDKLLLKDLIFQQLLC